MKWGRTAAVGALYLGLIGASQAEELGKKSIQLPSFQSTSPLYTFLRTPTPDVNWKIAIQAPSEGFSTSIPEIPNIGRVDIPNAQIIYFSSPKVAKALNGGLEMYGKPYFAFDKVGNPLVPQDLQWPSCVPLGRDLSDESSLRVGLNQRAYQQVNGAEHLLEQCLSRLPSTRFSSLEELMGAYKRVSERPGGFSCLGGFEMDMDQLVCLVSSFSAPCSFLRPGIEAGRQPVKTPLEPFTLLQLFDYNSGSKSFIVSEGGTIGSCN